MLYHLYELNQAALSPARAAAEALGIPSAYGSYAELIRDPEIEAVYNPLPNHLHVPISIEAVAAGKHVLCEKPIALSAAEAAKLIEARDRAGVLVQEAFMVRGHPQWLRARELVRAGAIGELRVVQGSFSYMNVDPANVRNQAAIGLTADQRTAISDAIRDTQERMMPLQWELEAKSEEATKLFATPRVDADAAMAAAAPVMEIEQRIKNEHLRLLIRIKNELTAEQQDKLRALHPEGCGPGRR